MIYRISIMANNISTVYDFSDPVKAVDFMVTAHKHFNSSESDDLATITMTIVSDGDDF